MRGTFTVEDVIDGDTIEVWPNWNWGERSGDRVRLANVNAPETHERGGMEARVKLMSLVSGRKVELRNAVSLSFDCLVCDVYVSGSKVTP